jgi:signal transduction histidine kinase
MTALESSASMTSATGTTGCEEHVVALESVGQFTAGIAHDFNNLLTIILSNVAALEDAHKTSNVPMELREIAIAAQRGRDMVKRLMQFVRQQPVDRTPVMLAGIAAELPRRLQSLVPAHIRLRVDCEDPQLSVLGDVGMIEEIILNLATNSRDAMPHGGTMRISMQMVSRTHGVDAASRAIRPGAYAMITVRDTGVGVDEATRRQMFEPFFSTKSGESGAGLGLAMTAALVRQLHGFIEVASTQGIGTSVMVSLPMPPERVGVARDPRD